MKKRIKGRKLKEIILMSGKEITAQEKRIQLINAEAIGEEKAKKQPAAEALEIKSADINPALKQKMQGRHIFKLGIAGALILAGLVIGKIWLDTYNIALGLLTIVFIGGGVYLFRRFWNKYRDSDTVIVGGAPPSKVQVNSLNIYNNKVVFEDMAKPEGQPWKCLNDNKNYFVHIWDKKTESGAFDGGLKAFALPDQQYYDPEVFAKRVLELPAHRRIFARKQSMFQKLSPFIMILVIAIEWIIIVSTTG